MRTLWPFRSGGVAGASSGVDGAVLTSAQTLSSAQQAQVRTNNALDATQVVRVDTTTVASTGSGTYADSSLIVPLAIGTHRLDISVVVTSQSITSQGAGLKLNFTGILSPSNPLFILQWDFTAFTTAGWPGDRRDRPYTGSFTLTNCTFSSNGYGVTLRATLFVTVTTAGNFSIQTRSATEALGANNVSVQGGSYLAATRYG